uniref:Uncharacterized protein n=1 Tax=Arundo donax TaxID=35708 RepID=A0A0A9H2D8_ARUDO
MSFNTLQSVSMQLRLIRPWRDGHYVL